MFDEALEEGRDSLNEAKDRNGINEPQCVRRDLKKVPLAREGGREGNRSAKSVDQDQL